jgi:acyl carrier protein
MNSETYQKVVAIIASVKGTAPETIKPESTLESLGMDSLDKINMLFELEGEFDIDIPDEEAHNITTVSQIVERLEKELANKAGSGA